MAVNAPQIDYPGVRVPEQEHQQTAAAIQTELANAGHPDAKVIPVTPDTHLEVTDKAYQVVTTAQPAEAPKEDPQLTGFAKWFERFKVTLAAWTWGRARHTDSHNFNQAKIESVMAKAEKK